MQDRSKLLTFIFLAYLAPLFGLIYYASIYVVPDQIWVLLPSGLLMSSIGSLIIYSLIKPAEVQLKAAPALFGQPLPPISSPFVEKSEPNLPTATIDEKKYQEELADLRNQVAEYEHQLEIKQIEVSKYSKDNERYQRQAELVLQEFAQYKKAAQEQIEQKGTLLADYQQTMSEQKAVIEKKQHTIAQLETKVRDLTYEIKTLLQLAEIGNLPLEPQNRAASNDHFYQDSMNDELPVIPENQIRTWDEAALQLRRCIDIAQKMTGSNHFASSGSRIKEFREDNFAIDYRRLFDNLRSENGATVIFYSQKENKLLFVNNQSKNLLGWSPEKFIQNFSEIIHQGAEEWKNGLTQLLTSHEVKINLMMKSKNGQDVLVQALLAVVPTGLFKHNVMGIFFT